MTDQWLPIQAPLPGKITTNLLNSCTVCFFNSTLIKHIPHHVTFFSMPKGEANGKYLSEAVKKKSKDKVFASAFYGS
jgi:hypothetical protein